MGPRASSGGVACGASARRSSESDDLRIIDMPCFKTEAFMLQSFKCLPCTIDVHHSW